MVGALAAIVVIHPYLLLDATVERALQAIDLGPLTMVFPFFSWIGGPGGTYMEAAVVLLVVVLNLRALLLAVAVLAGGIWYEVMVHVVNRPRPTPDQVLRVTEHPGASSFPSGHVIFIALSAAALMLCLGDRYLPPWAKPIGWVAVTAIIIVVGLDRVYVGAHWPTDVLAGALIATAWVSLVLSVRWISDRRFGRAQVGGY